MNEMQAEIGDGVTVRGPEPLIREAMGVPSDVFDVPSFLRSLATGAREDVIFDHVDALFGDDEDTQDRDDVCRRWRFTPGERVWDVGTGNGPWVLIAPTTLTIPVELPCCGPEERENTKLMFVATETPAYKETVYRPVKVNAWVVEVSPWRFELIPEACLDPHGRPIELSDEMLEALETEAAEEAQADLQEMTNPERGCTDAAIQAKHRTRHRFYKAGAYLTLLAWAGVLTVAALGWLTR